MTETKLAGELPEYLQLVTDSREVEAVLDHIQPDRRQDIDWVFVDTEDGDYTEVWAGSGVVVYDNDIARKLL